MYRISRRRFLASGALAAGALASPGTLREALAVPARAGEGPYGPLQPPDANGLMLPPGFASREVARGLAPVSGTSYVWPVASDGQATFATNDGGWILVTNAETLAAGGAGTSAIRFAPDGRIAAAYRILGGTNANCAGGPTPWGTWLSCEEYDAGLVWECDPAGLAPARPRPALGVFKHEAAAVEPQGRHVYLTEDEDDGGFYRFAPDNWPDLSAGRLEVAVVASDGSVSWRAVPHPTAPPNEKPTRQQVDGMTRFEAGEGIWHDGGVLYFTTKKDKRVWAYDARAGRIEVLFDRSAASDSSLDAVDNITVSAVGEIFVCEDGGNMEIGLITPDRVVSPFLRFTGPAHSASEVCGAVFDPSGTRMYCTSQRADPSGAGQSGPGAVYEISGPFHRPAAATPPPGGSGPPTEEGTGAPGGRRRPRLRLRAARRVRRGALMRRGLVVRIEADAPLRVTVVLDSADLLSRPGKGGSTRRPKTVALARGKVSVGRDGRARLRLRLGPRARRLLRRRRRAVIARLVVSARDGQGRRVSAVRRLRILSKP